MMQMMLAMRIFKWWGNADCIRGTKESEEEEDGEGEEKILHSDAYKAFKLRVEWLHQQSEMWT